MDIKKTFKNAALAVLNGIGAAYMPAMSATLQQESVNRTYNAFAFDVDENTPAPTLDN
jgi:hypothetical protein